MRDEVEAAVGWWTVQLSKKIDHRVLLEQFHKTFRELLYKKYREHWYPQERLRGSSFRTISYDRHLDPLLVETASIMGMMDASKLFVHVKNTIMFVNPGEVKVSNTLAPGSHLAKVWNGDTDPKPTYECPTEIVLPENTKLAPDPSKKTGK